MRVRQIAIGVRSLRDTAREFVKVYNDAVEGRCPEKPIEGLYFADLETMRKFLTPKRLELLRLIRELEPDSVYALARAAGRDLKNVQEDVAMLADHGLVDVRRSRTRRARVIPRVSYDRIRCEIPLDRVRGRHAIKKTRVHGREGRGP